METPTLVKDQEERVLTWLKAAALEGAAILKKEPALQNIVKAIDYVEGRHTAVRTGALSKITDNRLRKTFFEMVSALTDLRQIWDYKTDNPSFKNQAEILNKLVRSWWRSSYSDLRLQEAIKYAMVGGSGYLRPIWNPDLPGGGDIDLEVVDPRDVVPIRPSRPYTNGVQDWRGVMIRQRKTVNWLVSKYPHKASKIAMSSQETWFDTSRDVSSTILTTVDRLFANTQEGPSEPTLIDYLRVFIKDDTIHTGDAPRLMGTPDTNWSYIVYPVGSTNPVTGKVITEEQARLYPRGRLIICTPTAVLEDIPSPYWHGQFPLIKLTLDPTPWTLLGGSVIANEIPLQDALNETLRGLDDGIRQWIKRTVVADKNAIARGMVERYDPRKGGQYLMLNPSAGDGIKLMDGPNIPPWYIQMLDYFKNAIDDNTGVRGLREATQLKQMPSPETIDKLLESQTPLLRLRGRVIEQALGELAEQVKVLIFQYYDTRRRVQILGDDGVSLEDFDYDPNTLVPALRPGDPNYLPELDEMVDRPTRAASHHKNFTFSVAPNTFLNMSHIQQKMMYLQLLRIGMVDPYTALEAFDVPNLGTPPPGSVFDRMMYYAQLGVMGAPAGPPQQGRPPSGQEPPQFVQKTSPDGTPRQVVSESGRGGKG